MAGILGWTFFGVFERCNMPTVLWRLRIPDWIERVSESQAKAAKQFPAIPLKWEATTVPELPNQIRKLPANAQFRIDIDAIHIHVSREPAWFEDVQIEQGWSCDLTFPKEGIVSIDIIFMPELADGTDMRFVSLSDFSRVVIRHRDPFEVVPFFESTFTATDPYWPKGSDKSRERTFRN